MRWSREEIVLATGGKVVVTGKRNRFREIVIDSRKARGDSVFVALRGENFDGHDFIDQAVHRGARCLVVARTPRLSARFDGAVIKVRDTLTALGELARYRRRIVDPKVLAITGSNGKTTTKEMVAAIMERAVLGGKPLRGRVLKTEGNYNNLVGLPLTLLGLRGRDKVAVVELGTSRPGEIGRLTEIADPDVAVITSVAPAHLTGLRTIAGVASEKGALFRNLGSGAVAIVNLNDPWTRRLGKKFKGRKVTCGRGGKVSAERESLIDGKGMRFVLNVAGKRQEMHLNLLGEHNVTNAVLAAAMAHASGAGLSAIRKGLMSLKPLPMRMSVEHWRGAGIIHDAYNANPASMEAALKTLTAIRARGEKIAVLGDMLELGAQSRARHRELGRQAARFGVDRLYCLGAYAATVARGAARAGMDGWRIVVGKSPRDVARRLRKHVKRGDWLLFKASRGLHLERVIESLRGT
jgi:UDP-N-acetylmuramoyl-tripeptide--D-alanyl-D-alanine ligase